MRELALFAGAGGGILGGQLLGWETVCAVEIDGYAAGVLASRQDDGSLPPFPIWDDIRTFDGRPWRGFVDVVSGGFPCQDISTANTEAEGIEGARSGLWGEQARIIGEIRPSYIFVENSPALTFRGMGKVGGDLAAMGYDACWGVVAAQDAIFDLGDPAAYHERGRIWILGWRRGSDGVGGSDAGKAADTYGKRILSEPKRLSRGTGAIVAGRDGPQGSMAGKVSDASRIFERREEQWSERQRARAKGESVSEVSDALGERQSERGLREREGEGNAVACICSEPVARSGEISDASSQRQQQVVEPVAAGEKRERSESEAPDCSEPGWGSWWIAEPDVGRVADGVASRVDRLRCLGNGQVPAVVRLAWETLIEMRTGTTERQ